MSEAIYKMAKRYYPDKWNKAMIDNLYSQGKLTETEYNDIVGASDETGDSN